MARPKYLVTGVEVIGASAVRLTFADGSEGDADLSRDLTGPIFELLKDPAFFRQVRVDPEGGTIVWPNGADIAPETLYGLAHGLVDGTADG